MLAEAFGGHVSAYYPSYSDAPLARVHYIIGVTPAEAPRPGPAVAGARDRRVLARTWTDDFEAVVRRRAQPDEAAAILAVWSRRLPARLPRPLRRRRRPWPTSRRSGGSATRRRSPSAPSATPSDSPRSFRFKLYRRGDAGRARRRAADPRQHGPEGALRGGLRADAGRGARADGARSGSTSSCSTIRAASGSASRRSRQVFEEAFLAVWGGQAESDGFNRLVLELAIAWRAGGADPRAGPLSPAVRPRSRARAVQQQALSDHPEVAAPDPRAVPPSGSIPAVRRCRPRGRRRKDA